MSGCGVTSVGAYAPLLEPASAASAGTAGGCCLSTAAPSPASEAGAASPAALCSESTTSPAKHIRRQVQFRIVGFGPNSGECCPTCCSNINLACKPSPVLSALSRKGHESTSARACCRGVSRSRVRNTCMHDKNALTSDNTVSSFSCTHSNWICQRVRRDRREASVQHAPGTGAGLAPAEQTAHR